MLIDAPFNAITHDIIGAAIEVHRQLGPGLLESIYMECLQYELTERRMRFVTQLAIPVVYKGQRLMPVHEAQALSYMALLRCPAGLLINFNVWRLADGVKRLLLKKQPEMTEATEGNKHGEAEKRR